jgi:hypothetical protein
MARRMNKTRDLPGLIEIIRALHAGKKLYKVHRMYLTFDPDSFDWAVTEGDKLTYKTVSEDEHFAIAFGGKHEFLNIGPEEKDGELTLRWQITPTTEGWGLAELAPPPVEARPELVVPVQGATLSVPAIGLTVTIDVGRVDQGMGHGYNCIQLTAPAGYSIYVQGADYTGDAAKANVGIGIQVPPT